MRIEQMRDYWQRRYGAANLILAVAGKFDWEHLVDLAEQYCGDRHTGDASRAVTSYEPPHPLNNILFDKKLKQQILMITMPTVYMRDPD